MVLGVEEMALVSPLGLTPSEHVFFRRAEVSPHASGAFTNEDGEAFPIHDCSWIPAVRPWASRVRLLARQALSHVAPSSPSAPILLVAPVEAAAGDADLPRFLSLGGRAVAAVRTGSAAYLAALAEAEGLLSREPEVVVLAVDSLLSRERVEAWAEARYSGFTRNPLPPSEGAAAVRLVSPKRSPLAGKVLSIAYGKSAATDHNDLAADGVALTRAFGEIGIPPKVPLVVGPRDEDPLRTRDFHIAAARHRDRIDGAEMPSLEGSLGRLGSAGGLMSLVFALAWLRHDLPLPAAQGKGLAVAWARSEDGTTGAALVGGEAS